ncbi:hypothetical protein PWT90_08436 [Aphanocladium album]|nr:hypothetical protein PWT90_08436 [Aphanocladium album]
MAQLVASPFSLPRKLISILVVSGSLAFSLMFLQVWYSEIDLSNIFTQRHARNSTELSAETDRYLSELIHTHSLSPRVEWAAWNIFSTQNQEVWKSVTRVPRRFQPRQPRIFDPDLPSPAQSFPTLTLPSPRGPLPGQSNASRYLFGVSTTYERLVTADDGAMLRSWQRWLTDEEGLQNGNGHGNDNGAHVVVMLDRADDEQITEVEGRLAALGIAAMVYNADEPLSTATRYAQLAGELHAYGSALAAVGIAKTWFVLLDDSVFFPSLSYLDETLGTYDAKMSVYVGVPSNREDWTARDGKLSTSGGGGGGVVILSRKGLGRYVSLSCDENDDAAAGESSFFHAQRWTSVLHECLTTQGGLPMQVIPGVYPPPAAASDSLLSSEELENGARPVVLRSHHTVPGAAARLASAYLVADRCGEACFAQRFLFRDNWVLVNGVSVSQYQHPLTIQGADYGGARRESHEQQQQQLPLNGAGAGASLHLAGGGARNVWRLLDSSVDDYGVVWQAYVRREVRDERAAMQEEEEGLLDSVIILLWNEAKE